MKILFKQVIYGNPITKKNSQRIVTIPVRYGTRPMIMPSKQYKQYEKDAMLMIHPPATPISTPVNVKCIYYMETKRRVDLVNLLESTCDIMVKAGVLEDDNSTIIVGHDGSRVCFDKDNPRVEIEISDFL